MADGNIHNFIFTDRFCTNHQGMTKVGKGGMWKVINKGRQRRWMCDACYSRLLEKRNAKANSNLPSNNAVHDTV